VYKLFTFSFEHIAIHFSTTHYWELMKVPGSSSCHSWWIFCGSSVTHKVMTIFTILVSVCSELT
jgi:hypothetical protein